MNLKELMQNPQFTVNSISCSLIVRDQITQKEGKVIIEQSGEFSFETSDTIHKFTVSDENEKLIIADFFKRNYFCLATVKFTSKESTTFILDMIFFPRK